MAGDYLGGEGYWAGGLHLYTPLPFRPGKGGFGDLFRMHFFLNAGNLCNLNYGEQLDSEQAHIYIYIWYIFIYIWYIWYICIFFYLYICIYFISIYYIYIYHISFMWVLRQNEVFLFNKSLISVIIKESMEVAL